MDNVNDKLSTDDDGYGNACEGDIDYDDLDCADNPIRRIPPKKKPMSVWQAYPRSYIRYILARFIVTAAMIVCGCVLTTWLVMHFDQPGYVLAAAAVGNVIWVTLLLTRMRSKAEVERWFIRQLCV